MRSCSLTCRGETEVPKERDLHQFSWLPVHWYFSGTQLSEELFSSGQTGRQFPLERAKREVGRRGRSSVSSPLPTFQAPLSEAFFGVYKLVVGRSWSDSCIKRCFCFSSFLKFSTIGYFYFRARFDFIFFFPLSWDSLPCCHGNPGPPPKLSGRCLFDSQGDDRGVQRPPQQPQPGQD